VSRRCVGRAFHLRHIRVVDSLAAGSILPPTAAGITADRV